MPQGRRNTHSLDQLQSLKQDLLATQRQAAAQAKRDADQREAERQAQLANDPSIFRQALQGVQPLHHETPPSRPKRPSKPDAQTLARRAAAMGHGEQQEGQMLSDTQAMLNPVASEAFLSHRQATLQHRVFEQLKTGKLRWYEAVDLHGCSIEEARIAVLQVIDMARQANQNVIKIVHGKGPQAILKTYVNGWLRQHREVLAFVSATPEQGGTGAVLVLIRRAERNTP
jgi:DNA-nicking Smr family endonuclease